MGRFHGSATEPAAPQNSLDAAKWSSLAGERAQKFDTTTAREGT
jgi:hypothetical protein